MSVATKRLPLFIEKLGKLSSESAIKKLCNSERRALRRAYPNDSSFRSVITRYRNAVRLNFPQNESIILKYIITGKIINKRINETTRLVTALRKYEINTLSKDVAMYAIEQAKSVLSPFTINRFNQKVQRSYVEITIGLCLLTGRRPSEVLTGEFEVISDNEMLFNGQLKTKGSDNSRGQYVIPLLCESSKVFEAIKELRKRKEFSALTAMDTKAMNNTVSHRLSIKVKRIFRDIEDNLKVSDLRKMYVAMCFDLYGDSGAHDIDSYYSLVLGHSVSDTLTANSYKKFNVNNLDINKIYCNSSNITRKHLNDLDKIKAEIEKMIDKSKSSK